MKKFKKFLAILLVASMIFTTNAVNVFAEGMNANQEEQLNEETVETSEVETLVEADDETDEELTPGSEKESEEEFIEEEEEESVGGEQSTGLFSVHGARPEDEEEEPEETTVEAKLGTSEIELELDKKKNDDQLYGDDPATPFAYWIVTGDGDDKTIHYYATAGEGRTAVTIDVAGIEYTGLDDSEREEIKKAVIEEPIVATDVRNLFLFFKSLVSITDLGKLDTTSATSFESMFDSCNAIEELDVSGLETDSLQDTSYMFSQCISLTKLTFGNYFDTSKVSRMDGMFGDCTEITELDLTSFNTSSVTEMDDMFLNCTKLKKIYVSDDFTVENVEYGDDMFTDSTQLEGGSGTLYSNVSAPYDKRYAHIDEGTTNPGFFSSAPTPTAFAYWIVTGDGDNKTIHYYATAGEGRTAIVLDETTGVVYSGLDKESVKYAIIEDKIEVTDAKSFFSGFYYLETITGLSNLDTSKATSFWSMFLDCESLTGTLDVSTFDTSSLIYMHQMFSSCALLTSINFGDNFDTSNVTNMSSLFYACSSLQTITFGDKFKTNKVTEMGQMFSTCNDLQSLDLTGFDTSVVVDMEGMFGGCMALTSLDLTSFDTSSVTNMREMFASCLKLKKIYVSDGFTVENVEYSDDMFRDNTQLEGGSGTLYSNVSAPYDKTYAHIDGGTTNPGFFSGASTPTIYTVTYNQNLPSGYSLSDGKTWYSVATTSDLSGDPIELEGNADMTCEDTSGNVRTLEGWNTAAGGAGTSYVFGETINDATKFTEDTLDLYAVWSEPVAPGPTAFAYWIVTGDGDDKTIYYYPTAGEGRTAVDFDENGVVYTSLSEDDRISIKKAVFEEPIVATDVRSYFAGFKGLGSITNLGNLDTSNATSFKSMFDYCSAIKELDVSGLETNSLTDTSFMFSECNSLTKLTFGDYFDTSKVTNMEKMFGRCNALTTINFGSKFDTSNVTNMRNMFCEIGAETLDLTKFKTSKVTDMYGMFARSPQLKTINVSDDFKVNNVTDGGYMFYQCSNLVGEQGTKYTDTSEPWGVAYAYIDEGETKPGLFSGASTPTTYTITYNQNLPSGYTISTSKTWYTDSTSDDLSSNPIKISGSAGMTCENADGYVRKLETWNTLADKSGTPYMFAENINSPAAFTSNPLTLYAIWSDPVAPSTATDKFYIISYGNPTEYPNEKKIFAFDSTTTVEEMENFVANNISKCINPSGKAANGFYDMSELIPVGADDTQVRQILNNNYDLTKEKIRTLDKIAVWFEDYIPDPMGVYLGITFEGSTPTPPTPSPTPSYGGNTGGGDSSGSSTDGPIKVTNNNMLTYTVNNIPQSLLLNNPALYLQLMSYPENTYMQKTNAKDIYGNTGFGRWMRIPNTTTWYFYAGDFNNNTNNSGFLKDGWFNLGWDGVDRWYHFDSNGVMQLGWFEENGKIYFLQNDLNDNWYGKAVTGTHVIDGVTYTFDSTGALIQ